MMTFLCIHLLLLCRDVLTSLTAAVGSLCKLIKHDDLSCIHLLAVLCRDVLTSLTVALGAPSARFSSAVDSRSNKIRVSGVVRDGKPFLSQLGNFDVDVTLEVGLQGLWVQTPDRRRLSRRSAYS